MMKTKRIALMVVIFMFSSPMALGAYSIPEDQLDPQKIFYGNGTSFEKPAAVKIEDVIKSTPEYEEIVKKKIERGTGRYWILMSQATEKAVKWVSEVAKETEYDFVAADGYLDGLEPAIPSEDITELVLEKLAENS